MTLLKLTKIPQLNSIVIRQEGGHFFIAAPNSFIIDKVNFLSLIEGLADINFIDRIDLEDLVEILTRKELKRENEENSSHTN